MEYNGWVEDKTNRSEGVKRDVLKNVGFSTSREVKFMLFRCNRERVRVYAARLL